MQSTKTFTIHVLMAIIAIVVLLVMPFLTNSEEMRIFYISEGGPVQIFSAAGYVVVIVLLMREMSWADLSENWPLVIVPLAMCLREMDFHAHFTTYSITKTTLYVSPDVPIVEKLFGALVFILLGITAVALVNKYWRAFLAGLRQMQPVAMAVLAGAICAVLSKVLDGASSNLQVIGIDVQPTYFSVVAEEVLELGIPMFFAIAVFAAFPARGSLRRV
ncbi:hypothetical protein JYU29_00315 [Tianweitania sp. BSSL-BM11]|uniref:Uncharacterized protein n=1 Tax=Tianweitania aestuarii TaxID=2814886 RepID=A0ABS5RQ08_9HYPH|nr:hypothetical protein [Tianweitania aestuarii]MBS9719124.1 hypothetical protein [Tianweitania aestuarii]